MEPSLVWLVDDDEEDLELISKAFEDCCTSVKTIPWDNSINITNKLASLDKEYQPKLLILDLNMPMISGKELLKQIRLNKAFSHIPIAILTTSGSRQEKKECFALGANCCLTKPYSFDKLVSICSALALLFCEG